MAVRVWTVLLVMAGVFAMHGLQCATAHDVDHGSGLHPAATTLATAPATAAAERPALVHAGARTGHGTAGGPVAAADLTAPSVVEHEHTPGSPTGQLWSLCLAVLAAGIAALCPLLAPRLLSVAARLPAQVCSRVGSWPAPLRPPDLSALCLLRI
ncbi:hypothetical protein [Modestobacter sp. SYSU DS0875]